MKCLKDDENKYLKHMVSDPIWTRDLNDMRDKKKGIVLASQEIMRRHGQRLICIKCERAALRYGKKDRARCNWCGWEGKSVTVDEYLTQKLWR